MHFHPQGIRQPLHLPDPDAPAAQRRQRLFAHGVEHFAHEPQRLGDGAQRGVSAQPCARVAQPGDGRRERKVLDDKPAAQRHSDAVRQFDVRGVQRYQQPARQQPVHGADVGAFVEHGRPALRLRDGAHGPVPEAGQKGSGPVRCGGQDLLERFRCCRPVLQGQGGFHRRRGGGDGRPGAVKFPHQLHHALCKSRLEPHKFGVAAPQPRWVDANHVLEAADRKVVALLGGGGGRAVRRIGAVDEGQFLQGMEEPVDGGNRGAVDQFLQHRRRRAVPGIGVGAQVQGFQDLHLRAVEPFECPLHADASAGAGGEGGEVRDAGRNQVRPRGEQGPQRFVASCLKFLAERADEGHRSNVTFRRARAGGAGLPPRRQRGPA